MTNIPHLRKFPIANIPYKNLAKLLIENIPLRKIDDRKHSTQKISKISNKKIPH